MNGLIRLPQRLKMTGLFLVLLLIVIGTVLNAKFLVQQMDQIMTSVYQDRLQPAVELVYIDENLHARRLLMETYLAGPSALSVAALRARLAQTTADSYRRISLFEKTELTVVEAHNLNRLKANLSLTVEVERSILRLMASGQSERAIYLFRQPGQQLFQRDRQTLHELVHIQAKIGQEAVDAAHRAASGSMINNTLFIALAVLIGLLGQQIVQRARERKREFRPFHLN